MSSTLIVENVERIYELERLEKAYNIYIRFLQLSLQLYFQAGYKSLNLFISIYHLMVPPQSNTSDSTNTGDNKAAHFMNLRVFGQNHYNFQDHGDEISLINNQPITDNYYDVIMPICLVWSCLSILAIVGLKCIDQINSIFLYLSIIFNVLLSVFILVFGFLGGDSLNNQPERLVIHRYATIQILNCLVVCLFFIVSSSQSPKRFSNSPGNFVWVWLFLGFKWSDDIRMQMIIIGLVYFVISMSSVLIYLAQIMKGFTTFMIKATIIQWIVSIVLTVATEIYAIVFYKTIKSSQDYLADIASHVFQVFIIVNLLDLIFWITGRCI